MKVDVTSASGPAEDAPEIPETPEIKTPETTDFKTPEQIAADDDLVPEEPTAEAVPATTESGAPSWRSRLNLQWPPRRKEYIVAAVLAVLIIGGIVGALALGGSDKPAVVVKPKPVAVKPKLVPKPTTVPSTLTGLPVDPSVNQRPVTAVMVENSLDARPQSGLSQAGVVFEAIAEGGVTRFMAVYQDTQPDDVGPIRSARPYYVAWALGFDAGYAHVGGSPEGLADIRSWGARDLDQFANGGSYHRIDSRSAPHNVYTGIPTLTQLETDKGYTTSKYSGFVRKVAAPSAAPTAKSIDFGLSGYYYNPHFDYNPTTNSYERSEAGAAHIDQSTGKTLSPNVVVALITPLTQGELDSSDAYYSNYTVVGSGAAYVFQDGLVTIGTWTKASNTAQIVFTDAAGQPLGLNPGQTWLTAVSDAGGVSYNP